MGWTNEISLEVRSVAAGNQVEQTNEISLEMISLVCFTWFPAATDLISRQSQKVDWGLYVPYIVGDQPYTFSRGRIIILNTIHHGCGYA